MEDLPQALHEAFPEHADKIRQLLEQDPTFRQRAQEYHQLSRAAHRALTHEEPTEEIAEDELRKRRDLAKDELMRLILL